MEPIKRGDHVAILPSESALATDVLEILAVFFAGPVYVQLMDGRMYSAIGGKSLAARKTTYIVPATPEHVEALHKRQIATMTADTAQLVENPV